MELVNSEIKEIKAFAKRYGIDSKALINKFESGEWSNPLRNFPSNSQGTETIDTALRFSRDNQQKLQVQFAPKQLIEPPKTIDLDDKTLAANKFTIDQAGREVTARVGFSQISGTLLDDNGKLKLQIDGYYGNKLSLKEIETYIANNPGKMFYQKRSIPEANIQEGFAFDPKKQIKTAYQVDPMMQVQLLVNNLALMVKLGIPKPQIQTELQEKLTQEIDKKPPPTLLKLTAQEKDELKAYLTGEKQSHSVAIGAVVENNQQALGDSQTTQTVSLSQEEIGNLKSYIGVSTADKSLGQQFDPKEIDAYIVSLREMMRHNTPLPKPIPEDLKAAVVSTLDKKSVLEVDPKYNTLTMKQLQGQKSMINKTISLPKKSKTQSHNLAPS